MNDNYLLGCAVVIGDDTIPSANVTYNNDSATVRAVQNALKAKGYNPGTVDGVYGPNTAKAIRAMQAAIGAEQNGNIDYGVLAALAVSAPAGGGSSAPARVSSYTPPSFSTPSSGGYMQIVPQAGAAPGATSAGPVSFLQKEAFGGLKVWQASALGLAAAGILAGTITAIVRR